MKLLVLSSHTSSLFWFRMDMMKNWKQKGHTVIAVGSEPEVEWVDKFATEGITYRQLEVSRNGMNPLQDMKTFRHIKRILQEEKPDKIFAYQAKTVIYGALAARLCGIREFYALIAGLGSIFIGHGIKNKVLRMIMQIQYQIAFACSKKVFFQNQDDRKVFLDKKLLKAEKIVMMNGSGVNLTYFTPQPLPEKTAFLYIGRLIQDKGVMEYLKACEKLKERYPNTVCLLVGPFDSNPSALKPEQVQYFVDKGVMEYVGEQRDVRPYMERCSVYVLPSYHEGTPKTVLEAMAMGRAILTTDAPGCKETVEYGKNGYLVPVRNSEILAEKMEIFVNNPEICVKMGNKSLKIAQEKYDVRKVNQTIAGAMGL